MPSKFGETLKFILQVGRHLEKFRRIIGVKKNKEKCSKKIMKSVSKTLQTFAPSKSRENIKKDWRKKKQRKKAVEFWDLNSSTFYA